MMVLLHMYIFSSYIYSQWVVNEEHILCEILNRMRQYTLVIPRV